MSDIFTASEQLVDLIARHRPTEASFAGITGQDHRWDDFSPTGIAAYRDDLLQTRATVAAMARPAEPWGNLAHRVAVDHVDRELALLTDEVALTDLNNLASPFQSLTQVFDTMDTTSADGFHNIAARLHGLPAAAASYQARLADGARRGLTAARRQVLAVIEQGRAQKGDASALSRLPAALATAGIADPELARQVTDGVALAIQAMATLTNYLESDYLAQATERDAVGRERYLPAAARHLGMELDPQETYAWGFSEIHRLRAEMTRVAQEIEPGATIARAKHLLKEDPARCAPSHDAFLDLMRARQAQALSDLDGRHFDVPNEIRAIDVKKAPPGGALGAYYLPPSEDFKRAGTVWYSLSSRPAVPLYDEISTAYHEGFPGHHLQVGVQVTLADRLSRLQRRLHWSAGHGEGWALYTELLMDELGYYEKPDYRFGMLANQMFRSCRIAIDIGSHLQLTIPQGQPFHPGEPWTFETAVELMTDYGTMADDYARSEVTRYLGWPGQAISYKVGERVILGLRDELKRRRGAEFDLKEFHNQMIGSGSVGLATLKDLVLG